MHDYNNYECNDVCASQLQNGFENTIMYVCCTVSVCILKIYFYQMSMSTPYHTCLLLGIANIYSLILLQHNIMS